MSTGAAVANPWLAAPIEIAGVTPELAGVATYHMRFRDAKRHAQFRFRPGQFNMLYLPGVGEIAISLSGAGGLGGTWDHTIRVAGNVTRALADLGPGGSLGLRGPYGSWWPVEETAGADLVVVAGGIGLAPLRPVLDAWLAAPKRLGRCTLLYGGRTPDTLLYAKQHARWADAGVDVQTTVDRADVGWTGNVGVVPLLLDRIRPLVPKNTVLLVCGPEVMMRYAVLSGLARGLAKEQIWVSLERNMQCAVGLCGHCQLGPAFVCKDGPIFRYDKIEPYFDVEGL